jgi:hypothetical protein
MSQAADRTSINTPMSGAEVDLPRQIAESLVDPAEVAGSWDDAPGSHRPVTGDTPMTQARRRRRRALKVAVGALVVGAGVGSAVVASLPPTAPAGAAGESSTAVPPEHAVRSEPSGVTSRLASGAGGAGTEPAPTTSDSAAPRDAAADETAKPETTTPPRRGGGRKKDGLYWPSRL